MLAARHGDDDDDISVEKIICIRKGIVQKFNRLIDNKKYLRNDDLKM